MRGREGSHKRGLFSASEFQDQGFAAIGGNVPRTTKKAVVPGQAVAQITCPGCQSKISSDGSTLHGRSKYLEELIDKAAGLDEVDKAADALEKKNDELKAQVLRLQDALEK